MTEALDLKEIERRMDGAVQALSKDFSGLRTGRASASLVDGIMVDAYGSMMPLNQCGTVSVPEARLITITVWDKGMAKAVEKAIVAAGLGLNPQTDGNLIRLPIPPLSEERRNELAKVAGKYAESAKIAVRNIRRDGMDAVKKQQKDGQVSEDEQKKLEQKIQQATDAFIKKIDETLANKEKEIKQV